MDAQKASEVEMKELTLAEVKDDKDAGNTQVEGTKDFYRKLKLYKWISVFFLVLTLLLLAVVLVLAIKLNESKSIPKCPEPEPPTEEKKPSYPVMTVSQETLNQCSECAEDWYQMNTFCIFLAKKRLNWHESREACQKLGADLVVINNERLQNFLSKTTGLMYWIGLHYSENKWMWVNNTALTKSYWAPRQPKLVPQGHSCALLKGQGPNIRNWHVNPCDMTSHYICQKLLKVQG
ncbi:CD209 antigen-like protein C [Clarias gariepinus]